MGLGMAAMLASQQFQIYILSLHISFIFSVLHKILGKESAKPGSVSIHQLGYPSLSLSFPICKMWNNDAYFKNIFWILSYNLNNHMTHDIYYK